MVSVSITWHIRDNSACPICKAVNGYTWTFENTVPDSLIHPTYGEIWNKYTGSLAHEHKSSKVALTSNCRCRIEPKFDLKELLDKTRKLHQTVTAEYGEPTK